MKKGRFSSPAINFITILLAIFFVSMLPAQGQIHPVTVTKEGKQPKVAISSNGDIFVVYGLGNDIFLRTSRDSGTSYSDGIKIASVDRLMLGMRRGPQIAATKDYITVSAIGKAGNLATWRSKDRGVTWSGPVNVNDQDGTAREGLHSICAGAGNDVLAVWLDLRDRKTKLFGSRSRDGGKSWLSNILIYESPDGHICECCHPSVVSDQKSTVYVMWRNWLEGARDMYLSTSRDGGSTFGKAQKLGTGSWPLKACPMDGGSLVVDKPGRVVTVWRRENKVYAAQPGRQETLLGEGSQPVVAAAPRGIYRIWQAADSIMLSTSLLSHTIPLGKGAYPAVAASPNRQGPLIAVWEAKGQGEGGIISARLDGDIRSEPRASASAGRISQWFNSRVASHKIFYHF